MYIAIATNIPVLLMTAFKLQGHIYHTAKCADGATCGSISIALYAKFLMHT